MSKFHLQRTLRAVLIQTSLFYIIFVSGHFFAVFFFAANFFPRWRRKNKSAKKKNVVFFADLFFLRQRRKKCEIKYFCFRRFFAEFFVFRRFFADVFFFFAVLKKNQIKFLFLPYLPTQFAPRAFRGSSENFGGSRGRPPWKIFRMLG